jgi:excisionase family DNA binding protein
MAFAGRFCVSTIERSVGDELLSTSDTCIRLRLPYARILDLIFQGTLEAHRIGRFYRITASSVADFERSTKLGRGQVSTASR